MNRLVKTLLPALLALTAAPAAWAAPIDCSGNAIPDAPVKGTVMGKPFVVKEASVNIGPGFAVNENKFDSYDFTLMVDGIFNALSMRVIVRQGQKADGKTFRLLPVDSIGAQPAAVKGVPEVQSWDLQLESADVDTGFTQETASMRLEVGQRKNGVLPGKIYFCTLDKATAISGTFQARIAQ